ncbi:MAG: hypothetical protein Q9222_007807, partial [Ikaeria aurantiellina]
MRFLTRLVVAIPLLFSLVQAIPAELIERTYQVDATNCKRSDADRNLVRAEFLTARAMMQAAAGAVLDANNKWANYFFDSGTLGKTSDSSEYYANISRLQTDSSYRVPIYCPVVGDAQYTASCRAGKAWAVAYARPASARKIVICPVWFDGLPSGTVKESSSKVRADCKASSSASSKWQVINQFKFTKCKQGKRISGWVFADIGYPAFTLFHEATHLEYGTGSDSLPNAASLRSKDYAYGRQNCSMLKAGTYENPTFCPKNSNGRYLCDPSTTFRNADSLSFVAAGIYWENQCGKTIGFAPTNPTAEQEENMDTEINDAHDTPNDEAALLVSILAGAVGGSGTSTSASTPQSTDDGSGGSTATAKSDPEPTKKKPAKATPTKKPKECNDSGTFSEST